MRASGETCRVIVARIWSETRNQNELKKEREVVTELKQIDRL